jgi:hypothetical protein
MIDFLFNTAATRGSDCAAAIVGTATGAVHGKSKLPSWWIEPVSNRLLRHLVVQGPSLSHCLIGNYSWITRKNPRRRFSVPRQ